MRRAVLVVAAIVALFIAGVAAAALFTFGSSDSTISTSRNNCGNGLKNATVLTSPKAGTLNTANGGKVEGYYDGTGAASGTQNVRMVIYAIDAQNKPSTLLGVSAEKVVHAGDAAAWQSFSFPTTISIPAGKIGVGYWCGGPTSNLIRPFFDTQPETLWYNNNTYSSTGNPANPFGTASSLAQGYVVRVTADDGTPCVPTTTTVTSTTTVTVTSTVTTTVQGFGISHGGALVGEADATRQRELDNVVTLHGRFTRMDFTMDGLEPQQGSYNFGPWDTAVNEANARGLHVVAMLGYAPAWANGGHSDDKYPPTNPADYASFAGTVAAHFAPMGVHIYELWNEPNTAEFWKDTPNVAAYAALVKAAYPAIHAADSQATVLAGAMAPHGGYQDADCDPSTNDGGYIGGPTGGYDAIDFLIGMYANGAGGNFDALSHHPYDRNGLAFHPCSEWSQQAETNPSLVSIMAQNGDGGKRIWATEYGNKVSCTDPWTDLQGQADRLDQAMTAWKTYSWAGNMLVFNLWDTSGDCFGIVNPDWTPRPAYTTFQTDAP